MHPFGCSFGWSWFLSNKMVQGFEFLARNKIQFIPEGFPVTSRRLRPLDSFALRMSKVLGRLLIDYYANCRGLSGRPLHPFGCSFGWSWFLSNKMVQGFEFLARNKIQFIPEGFPVTSRRLRPLDSFAAPSDGNDVYRKKGCARRWQKNLFISMSLGRKFSSSEHPAAFRGERMFQLVFGWVREGLLPQKPPPAKFSSFPVPRLYFLRLFVDRGGRACYTGCNFIRTALSHERL